MFDDDPDEKQNRSAIEKYELACNYKAEGNFKTAIKLFEEALNLNPDYVEALNNLGNIYNTMEKYENALPFFLRADRLMPDEPIILNNLGITLMELAKIDEAKEKLEKAIRINPNFYQAYTNLGKVFTLKNDLVNTKKCLQKALEINPFDQRARLRLESAEKLLKNLTNEELKSLQINIEETKTNSKEDKIEEMLQKAQMYNLANQSGQAIYFYEEVLKLNPNEIEALNGIANVYLRSGNYKKTIDYSNKILTINKKNKDVYFNLGAANYYLGKFNESLESFLFFIDLVENDQDKFDANYMLGITYFGLGDFANAIEHLKSAVEIKNPSQGEAYYALANSYSAIGDEDHCLSCMQKAAIHNNRDAINWLRQEDQDDLEVRY